MTIILSAMAFKGGATKTSTIINLAAACARANLLTVVIDGDMQGNAGSSMGVERDEGFYSLLVDGKPWKSVLRNVPPTFTNRQDAPLMVLTGGFQTSNLKKNARTVPTMQTQIDLLRGWADVVLIDTAPGYDDIHAGAYAVSDFVILPTLMELDSVESLDQTFQVMKATQDGGGKLPRIWGILPNRFTPKYASNLAMHDTLKILYRRNYKLFDPIMESVAFQDARGRVMSIYAHAERLSGEHAMGRRYDKRAARRAVDNFDQVLGRQVVEMAQAVKAVSA